MKLGSIGTCALGLTVALTLGSVSASAQTDTTMRDTASVPGSTSGTTTARTGRRMYHTVMLNDSTCARVRTNSSGTVDTTQVPCRNMHRRHRTMRTATSSTRIPVTKQSSGEVAQPAPTPAPPPPPPPAPDTTTPAPPPPPPPPPPPAPETTTVKTDTTATTTAVVPPLSLHRLGSFYWGIGAGASVPQQNMTNGYHTGWNVTVPFGWDSQDIPLGLRADLGYDRLSGRSDVGVNGDLAIWSANADAKLRLGSLLRHFYVLGGLGANRIVGYGTNSATYTTTTTSTGTYGTGTTTTTTSNGYNGTYPTGTVATSFGNAKTEMNWNAGGGVDFGWGRSALFLESRYFHVNTNDSFGANTRFVPIILGLTFR